MNQYMVIMRLPEELGEDFYALVPKQRRQVHRLLNDGEILSYSLAEDRSRVWVVLEADSLPEVRSTLRSLPLFPYLKVQIQPLLFHEAGAPMPALILN